MMKADYIRLHNEAIKHRHLVNMFIFKTRAETPNWPTACRVNLKDRSPAMAHVPPRRLRRW